MLITSPMIYDKLNEIELLLMKKSVENVVGELQEFSLNQTAKILKMSSETLRIKAENHEIECLVNNRSNAKDGITFSFLAKHIKNYQEKRIYKGNHAIKY